jgi:hypothetical protein
MSKWRSFVRGEILPLGCTNEQDLELVRKESAPQMEKHGEIYGNDLKYCNSHRFAYHLELEPFLRTARRTAMPPQGF